MLTQRPIFKGTARWPLKMGPIDCPETSVINFQSTLRKIVEERGAHSRCGCSPKLRHYQFLNGYSMQLYTHTHRPLVCSISSKLDNEVTYQQLIVRSDLKQHKANCPNSTVQYPDTVTIRDKAQHWRTLQHYTLTDKSSLHIAQIRDYLNGDRYDNTPGTNCSTPARFRTLLSLSNDAARQKQALNLSEQ